MELLFQTINYLGFVFYPAVFLLIVSGIFYSKYKRVFYGCLLFIALYIYIWITLNLVASHYGPGPFAGPTHTVTVSNAPFWEAVRATLVITAFYGFLGLVVSIVRKMMRYPTKKLFIFSMAAVIVGLTGVLVFYLLPCELSPDGCRILSPSLPIPPR